MSSFKDLILYNLVKYLLTGDELYMKKFVSLCLSFGVDRVKMLNRFYSSKNTRLIAKALKCNTYLNELELVYPNDILRELLVLKLDKFTKTIKRSYKLPEGGRGVVVIYDNSILYQVDTKILDYIKMKYLPSVYKYSEQPNGVNPDDVPRDSTILIFGYEKLDYFLYLSCKKVLSNNDIKIKVSDDCIRRLLDSKNIGLVDLVFKNKPNNVLSNTLNEIYLSVKSTLYGEDSMSASN